MGNSIMRKFIIPTPHQISLGQSNQIKEEEMGGIYSVHGRVEILTKF
jgi:hypothetical protein